MESLLKNIIPTSLYLRWFNPKEDIANGNNVYLHINDDINNTTFSLKFKKGVTRYDVVAFLKELHDKKNNSRNSSSSNINQINNNIIFNNYDDNNSNDTNDTNNNEIFDDVIKQECSCLFEFYSKKELDNALNLLQVFTKDKYVFFGETNISVSHEQDEENELWFTHFYKNSKKDQESKYIACICNSYTYVFNN